MLKVLLATPNFHQTRGNTITVKRMAEGLERLGVNTEIISITEEASLDSIPTADIVHGFHAYHFCQFMKKSGKHFDPYVVTITGTDLNHYLFDKEKRTDVIDSLAGANGIHVFDDKAKQQIVTEVPGTEDKIYTIPQGASHFPYADSQSGFTKEKDTFLFVLPAGIRKVKNVPAAIHMLQTVRETFSYIRLWIVGPVIEDMEGEFVKDLVDENSDWVKYLGEVPHSHMGNIYDKADALLNTSHSEGQSSAILEAMGYGLPVLVSDNLGNRSIVAHETSGLVYNNTNQFLDYAEQIINNNKLRRMLGENAKQHIDNSHASQDEAESLLQLYENVLR